MDLLSRAGRLFNADTHISAKLLATVPIAKFLNTLTVICASYGLGGLGNGLGQTKQQDSNGTDDLELHCYDWEAEEERVRVEVFWKKK